MARVCAMPDFYPVIDNTTLRKAGLRRFPFHVIYRVEPQRPKIATSVALPPSASRSTPHRVTSACGLVTMLRLERAEGLMRLSLSDLAGLAYFAYGHRFALVS